MTSSHHRHHLGLTVMWMPARLGLRRALLSLSGSRKAPVRCSEWLQSGAGIGHLHPPGVTCHSRMICDVSKAGPPGRWYTSRCVCCGKHNESRAAGWLSRSFTAWLSRSFTAVGGVVRVAQPKLHSRLAQPRLHSSWCRVRECMAQPELHGRVAQPELHSMRCGMRVCVCAAQP